MINNCQYCGNSHETVNRSRVCAKHHGFKTLRQRQGNAAAPAAAPRAPRRSGPSFSDLAGRFHLLEDGSPLRYAYFLHEGDERAQMFQVRKDVKTGRVYVDGISSHSNARVKIEGAEAYRHLIRTADHQAEALALYGQVTNRCTKCHHKLVREPWVSLGYGEDCAKYVEGAA